MYYEKYLKYKAKYTALKELIEMEGGSFKKNVQQEKKELITNIVSLFEAYVNNNPGEYAIKMKLTPNQYTNIFNPIYKNIKSKILNPFFTANKGTNWTSYTLNININPKEINVPQELSLPLGDSNTRIKILEYLRTLI